MPVKPLADGVSSHQLSASAWDITRIVEQSHNRQWMINGIRKPTASRPEPSFAGSCKLWVRSRRRQPNGWVALDLQHCTINGSDECPAGLRPAQAYVVTQSLMELLFRRSAKPDHAWRRACTASAASILSDSLARTSSQGAVRAAAISARPRSKASIHSFGSSLEGV